MTGIEIKEVKLRPLQKDVLLRKFEMVANGTIIIADLLRDLNGKWYWYSELYGIGATKEIDTTYLDDTSINGIINEFVVLVRDWLSDEESFINGLKNEIDEDNVKVVIE